ncbi:hypothetical protein [Streptomyces mirabilis]|uniref:hypothetical protein n=1 Tax=Streptomyces mirabilis TaxID=68239 RepID=UPI0036615325
MRRCDEWKGDTEGGYPVAVARADPQLQQRPAVPQHEIVDLFAEQFQAADSMRRVAAKQRDLSQEQHAWPRQMSPPRLLVRRTPSSASARRGRMARAHRLAIGWSMP